MLSVRNYDEDVAAVRKYHRQRRRADQQVRSWGDPKQVARRAKVLRRAFPDATPQVLLPLVAEGIDPSDPVFQDLLALEIKRRARNGDFAKIGELAALTGKAGKVERLALEQANTRAEREAVIGGIRGQQGVDTERDRVQEQGRSAIDAAKREGLIPPSLAPTPGTLRGMLGDDGMDRLRRQAPHIFDTIQTAARTEHQLAAEDTGPGGLLAPLSVIGQGLGEAKEFIENPGVKLGLVSENDPIRGGSMFSPKAPGLEGVTRFTQGLMDAPIQAVNATIRQSVGRITGDYAPRGYDPFGLNNIHEQIPLYQNIAHGKSLGTGTTLDPDSPAYKAAAEEARRTAPLIHGRAFTPGRFVANVVTDPNDGIYDIISGGIDALVTYKLDPTNPIFTAYTASKRARGVILPERTTTEATQVLANARTTVKEARVAAQTETRLARAGEEVTGEAAEYLRGARAGMRDARTLAETDAGVYKGYRTTVRGGTTTEFYATGEGRGLIDFHVTNGGDDLRGARDELEYLGGQHRGLVESGADETAIGAAKAALDDVTTRHARLLGEAAETSMSAYKFKGPREFHHRLAYAGSEDEVMEILDEFLPTHLRKAPGPAQIAKAYQPNEYRWASKVPNDGVRPENPEESLRQLHLSAVNAQIPKVERYEVLGRAMGAETPGDWLNVVDDFAGKVARHEVTENGLSPEWAKAATRAFGSEHDKLGHAYFIDEITGNEGFNPLGIVNGHGVSLPHPHLPSEYISTGIPLPNPQTIRRLTKRWGGLTARLDSRADEWADKASDLRRQIDAGTASPDAAAQVASFERHAKGLRVLSKGKGYADVMVGGRMLLEEEKNLIKIEKGLVNRGMQAWRTARLFRPAWGVRVAGEGQLRLWANGFASIFSHPTAALGVILGANPDSRLGRTLARVGSIPISPDDPIGKRLLAKLGQGADDWLGAYRAAPGGGSFKDELAEEMADALNQRFSAVYESNDLPQNLGRVTSHMYDTTSIGEPLYSQGVVEELLRLRENPITREAARTGSSQALTDWLRRGEGRGTWQRVWKPTATFRESPEATPKIVGEMTDQELEVATRIWAETFVERVGAVTQGDARLMGAVSGQPLGEVPVNATHFRELRDGIDELVEQGWEGPRYVKVARPPKDAKQGANLIDRMMWNFMPKPDNFLNRNPVYRMARWKRTEELIPAMSPQAKARVIHNAETEANVPAKVIARMKATPASTARDALTLKEAEELSKAFGLQTVRDILYDLSERHQGWDQLRVMFPFGEAFQEVTTRWLKYVGENPKIARRLSQGLTQGEASGAFTDGPYGDTVFSYGPVNYLTEKTLGVPIPVGGSLSGLNIIGNGLPGVGPAVQIPAALLIPDTPDLDFVYKFIFPYGEANLHGSGPKVLAGLGLPNWANYLFQATESPERHRQFGDSVMHLMDYLASTGEYDLVGEGATEEVARLFDDAVDKAQNFAVLRALMSATLPSAPIPNWVVKDKNNRLPEIIAIKEHFNKIAHRDGYEAATDWLLEKHGAQAYWATQGHSESKGAVPTHKNQWDWVDEHDWIRDLAPETYGYLVPAPKGTFDYDNYQRLKDRGDAPLKNAKDRYALSRQFLAAYLWDKEVAARPDPDKAQQAELDEIKADLERDLGFNLGKGGDFSKAKRQINEIGHAANDPRFAEAAPDLSTAIKVYLALRAKGIERQNKVPGVSAKGLSESKKEEVARIRDWLVDEGRRLARKFPEFRAVWRDVFLREIPVTETSSVQGLVGAKPAARGKALAPEQQRGGEDYEERGGFEFDPAMKLDPSQVQDLRGAPPGYADEMAAAKTVPQMWDVWLRDKAREQIRARKEGGDPTVHAIPTGEFTEDSNINDIGVVRHTERGWEYRSAKYEKVPSGTSEDYKWRITPGKWMPYGARKKREND